MRLHAMALLLLAGCGGGPADEYDDFRERTRGLGDAGADAAPGDAGPSGRYQAICGKWLLRSLLQGGIDLGLRIEFAPPDGGECPTQGPATLRARIWLERHEFEEPHVLETTIDIDEQGRFDLIADPLILDKEVLRGEVDVRARLIMHSRTTTADEWCGDAEGSVTVPITLDLLGSTFYARRDDDVSLLKADLPFRCVDVPPPTDAAVPDAAAPTDGGVADAEPPPPTPDLSGVAAQAADLTGHWLVNVQTGFGVPLKLWLALTYSAGPEGGWLDGALRTTSTVPGTPPLATFGVPVESDGRFVIWLPDATLTGTVTVQGDILFAGATLDADHFCGAAAGNITSPFVQSLEGTTFAAERWTPGTEVPMGTPNRCP
jgi:hypothetical protein